MKRNLKGLNYRVIVNILVRGLAALVGVSAQVLVAKFVSTEMYGYYISLVTVFNFIFIFSRWGLDTLVIKEAARSMHFSDEIFNKGYLESLYSYAHYIISFTSAFFLLTFLLSNKLIGEGAYGFIDGPSVIIFSLVIFMPLSAMSLALLRGDGKALEADVLDALCRPVFFLIALWLCHKIYGLTVGSMAAVFLISYGALYFSAYFVARSERVRVFPRLSFSVSKTEIISWTRQSIPINITSLVGFLYFQIDTLMVAIMLGAREAGIYGMVSNFTKGITIAAMIILMHAQPIFAVKAQLNEGDELRFHLRRSLLASLVFAVLAWVVMAIFGKYALGYISPDYEQGYGALLVLCAAHVVNSGLIIAIGFCNMVGAQQKIMKYYMVGAIIAFGMNYVLLPVFGMVAGGVSLFMGLSFSLLVFIYSHNRWVSVAGYR